MAREAVLVNKGACNGFLRELCSRFPKRRFSRFAKGNVPGLLGGMLYMFC
jgi:hypothetical protein